MNITSDLLYLVGFNMVGGIAVRKKHLLLLMLLELMQNIPKAIPNMKVWALH